MKAYEKWADQNMYDRQETKKAWKAALGWLYDKLDYSIEHKEIKDIIEKELESR